jgi:hypothetical protein
MADNDIDDDTAPEDELYDTMSVPDLEDDQIAPPDPAFKDPEAEAQMQAAAGDEVYHNTDRYGDNPQDALPDGHPDKEV